MSSRSRRKGKRPYYTGPKPICEHCGERGSHFIPPSFGEPGFWTCKGKPYTVKNVKFNEVGVPVTDVAIIGLSAPELLLACNSAGKTKENKYA